MPPLERVRRWVPAAAFIGGFVWDALTLGKTIKPADLFILLGYLVGAAVILVAIGRAVRFRGSKYLNAVLQFFFGGIFSALFIFYFLSSSDLPGYLVVLGLAAILVGNEFLESAYSELTLSWAFFTLSAIMFFNFALAHLFHSVSTFWFYLGTMLAVLLVLVLRRFAGGRAVGDGSPDNATRPKTSSVRLSIAVAAVMLALHAFNAIPPVPLVKKEMLIGHDIRRRGGAYEATIESARWRFWRTSAPVFHRRGGERIYCFTSVFVPTGIKATIRHRWQLYDEAKGEWKTTSVIPFTIEGGRRTGYRGLTWKQNVAAGEWRVIAETESGAAVGIVRFRVEAGEPQNLKRISL